MAYSEWAYDAGQAIPANTVSVSWQEIDALTDGNRGRGAYVEGTAADLNPLEVYPVERIGTAPDQWYERDEANDTFAYIAGDGGLLYQITQAWKEMDYPTARRQARDILTGYFLTYDQSQFSAAQKDFGASWDHFMQYFKLAAWVTGWPHGNPPVEPYDPPQVVIDLDGDANQFTTAAEFFAFWNKYEGLNQEARGIAWPAWKDVQDATTTDEVRQIIAALPPIPGT